MRPDISIIGDLVAVREGEAVEIAPRQRTLLAVLVGAFGAPITVDRLVEAVWGEAMPGDPRSALRFHLSKLRSALEPGTSHHESCISTTTSGYRIERRDGLVDAWDLERDVSRLLTRSGHDFDQRLSIARRHAASFGRLLEEFALEEFAQDVRRRWDARIVEAALAFSDDLFVEGRHGDAVALLTPLNLADPYDEGLASKLIAALSEQGRRVEAVRLFDETQARLAEVGMDAGQGIRATLGEVLSSPTSALRALAPLPPMATRLVGRKEEVQQLESLIASEPVVRIAGLPGVGKTALAASISVSTERLDDRPVLWVSAPDPPRVLTTLRDLLDRRLGVVTDADNAISVAGERAAVVVLDGLEASPNVDELVLRMQSDGVTVLVVGTDLSLECAVLTLEPLDAISTSEMYRRLTGTSVGPDAARWLLETTSGLPALIAIAAAGSHTDASELDDAVLGPATGDLLDDALGRLRGVEQAVLRGISVFDGPVSLMDAAVLVDGDTPDVLLDLMRDGWLLPDGEGVVAPNAVRRRVRASASESAGARATHSNVVLGWPISTMLRRASDTARAIDYLAERDLHSARRLFDVVAPELWNAGRFEEIAAMSRDVVARSGDDDKASPRSLYFAAYASLQAGDPELTAACLRDLRAIEPTAVRTLLLDADLAWFNGDASDARDRFDEAAHMAGSDPGVLPTALFGRVLVDAHTGDVPALGQTVNALSAAVSQQPWLSAEGRGLLHLLSGEYKSAVAEFERGIEAVPLVDRRAALRRTLDANLALGDHDAARALWDEIQAEAAYTRVPLEPAAAFSGALLHHRVGEAAASIELLHRGGRSLRSRPAALWVLLGLSAAHQLSAGHHRDRLHAVIGRALHATDIRPLEPFVLPELSFRGPYDRESAVGEILATSAPTGS